MKTPVLVAIAATAALAFAAASAFGSARAPGVVPPIGTVGSAASGRVAFDDHGRDRIVLTTLVYELVIDKRHGGLVDLVDRTTGAHLIRGQNGCLWAAIPSGDAPAVTGCSYSRSGSSRLSYAWNARAATLTLAYRFDPAADRRADATATIAAHADSLDLRLQIASRWGRPFSVVLLPADLFEDASAVEAGYAPNYLPGIRFKPSFFQHVGNDVNTYPSRWAYADYLALDTGGSHLALYSVNPQPSPIAPVQLGFIHNGGSAPCAGRSFCITHAFETWIEDGQTWTSPIVRLRIGEPVGQTVVDYRRDNGIDSYPSLADKLGPKLAELAQAPLVKADLSRGLPPFGDWGDALRSLPRPALIHPVGFQTRGFDENDPDFLPPDQRFGSTEDFAGAVAQAHALGQLVMPYLNVSWWDAKSPSAQAIPSPLTLDGISVQNSLGVPLTEQYGPHTGSIVSPAVPYVRQRIAALLDQWRTDVPVDCLFFDQVGARPWRRDFNPAEPTPLAYDDEWLQLFSGYADRCLMVEDGWDRLAQSFVGFAGSELLLERDFDEPDKFWGAANWEPYPLADWLFHDKVLLYQHDLAESTMTTDPETLTFNAAFGFMLSYSWDDQAHTLDSPWLGTVETFQRALGPLVAGRALTGFRDVAPDVTETSFGDYSVVANWNRAQAYQGDGYSIAPRGFLARTQSGSVVAGVFSGLFAGVRLSAGRHYLVVRRQGRTLTVSQPLGRDTLLGLPATMARGARRVVALDGAGRSVAEVATRRVGGRLVFEYRRSLAGGPIRAYRIGAG